MPEFEARSRAVYDHDNEEPRPAGRRRRQVADWGVGEEIFDHMPGRRFERRPHQDIPRGAAADGRRTIVIETGDDELPAARPVPAEDEFASREEALRAREVHDQVWAGDEPFADDPAPADDRPADDGAAWAASGGDDGAAWAPSADDGAWITGRADGDAARAAAGHDTAEFVAASGGQHDTGEFAALAAGEAARSTDGIVRGGQAGRRTVKIGGRPAEFHGTPARARQRPPRTMHERLGPRPDRVAMWAVALGLLLILIAIATANA